MTPEERCLQIATLLDRYGAGLALFAAQWTDSPDDCVQEALIRLAGQTVWPDSPTAWLYRVVRNQAISQLRSSDRRKRHEAIASRLRPESSHSTSSVDVSMIAEALDLLEAHDREIIIARVWGKLTLEEIAEACGVSVSTAHRRYQNAIAVLRRVLAEKVVSDEW